MNITRQWLESKHACSEGKEFFLSEKIFDLICGVRNLLTKGHFTWANWLLTRVFSHKQNVLFAIYCAERVLKIFENKYPKDKRPRKAIQAAKKWIKNPTKENRNAAADAANIAANAADAANIAANAAYAANAANAADAANIAANANADAANAAAYAAAAAAYAAAAADAANAVAAADTDAANVAAANAANAAAYAATADAANAVANAAYAAYAVANADASYAKSCTQKFIINFGIKLYLKGDK